MPAVWRLTKTRYVSSAWDGEAARRLGGRWNSVGTAVVYTSATLALALVETLVHLPSDVLPAFTAIPVEFDEFDDAMVTSLAGKDLPDDWRVTAPPSSTMAIGDRWVESGRSLALKVPSVVVPTEFNYVLNPAHADFGRLRVGTPAPFPFDERLLRDAPKGD